MDKQVKLQLYPLKDFACDNHSDPIRYYFWPVIGALYRRRVEMCLAECQGGERVLEVGFGVGLTFQNLAGLYKEVHGLDLLSDITKIGRFFERKGIKTFLRNGNVLQMPYPEAMFDTVLLISILEHLKPAEQPIAMQEIRRVLRPAGQLVYGVPVERPFMVFMFQLMGYNIRKYHFSTEKDVSQAAGQVFQKVKLADMRNPILSVGSIYQIGHYHQGNSI